MSGGEWGSYSRTARICKVSHQHIRNVVERHGPKFSRNDAKLQELAYEPAPGEVEYHHALTTLATEDFLRQLLTEQVATEPEPITSTSSSIAIATVPEIATPEPKDVLPAYDIFANRVCNDRRQANRRTTMVFLATLASMLTLMVLMVAQKSLGLSLLLLPEVLGMWWVVMQVRRVVY